MNYKTTCASLALTLGLGVAANAAIIIPTTVTSTGTASGAGDAGTSLNFLVDGSGLSGTPTDDATGGGVTHSGGLSTHWVTNDPGAAVGDYFADVTGTLQLDFALGGNFDVSRMLVWGYDPGFGADAIKNTATAATISFSSDGVNFGAGQNVTFSAIGGTAQEALITGTNATHVRVLITDNGYDGGAGGDRVGLGEIRFGGTTAVPEPSSTALLGLGGLALIMRRRK